MEQENKPLEEKILFEIEKMVKDYKQTSDTWHRGCVHGLLLGYNKILELIKDNKE